MSDDKLHKETKRFVPICFDWTVDFDNVKQIKNEPIELVDLQDAKS